MFERQMGEKKILEDNANMYESGVLTCSLHSYDSCPSDEVVGGFFVEFE